MSENICCVCHQTVEPDAPRLGGRAYCAKHYAKVSQHRPSIWRAGLGFIAGQVGFVLLIELIVLLFKPQLSGWVLTGAGLVMALISSFIWMFFFYQQDRLEPEPKGYVLAVFILGALMAQAVGIPVLNQGFEVQRWLPLGAGFQLLGSILVVGVIQEFLKYAAVRYSVYSLKEFDERGDGIVYGTAAGLGYATMLNVNYVVSSGGVNLQAGVIRIVVTALAQASFAGITGYFLGRAKFEDEPVWWMPAGVGLAALLNGLFTVLRGELTTTALSLTGGGFNPWPGLLLATVVAAATFAALFYLIRQANKLTLANGALANGKVKGG